jgi:CheY-like chemotaxis protein
VTRILVIDDQAHVRATILIALRATGFEGIGAENAVSAIQAFESSHFDLAMVDLYMPDVDGVKLIKTLRQRSPNFPIIAMSGVLLGESHRTALDFLPNLPGLSGVVCLQKPFRSSALVKAIQMATNQAA